MKIINSKFISNSTIYTLLIILALGLNSVSIAFAQNKTDELQLTEAERKEANEIATQFTLQFAKTKDIAPIFKLYYASDFIERYRIEMRKTSELETWMSPFLSYRISLLEEGNSEEWQKFYEFSHNFFLSEILFILNKTEESKDKKFDIDKNIEKMFSPKLKKLFSKNPNTIGLTILKGNGSGKSKPISSLEEMRNSIDTLKQAVNIFNEENKISMSETTIMELCNSFNSGGLSETRVEITGEEYYGLPKGTRVITVVSPLMLALELAKIDNKLKIIATIPYAE